jgi:hypothetical protein
MPDLRFDPIFRHKDWVDNVDLIQAGGPNGFNIRMNSIGSDLHQVSTVVTEVDSRLDLIARNTSAPPLGPQLFNVALDLPAERQGGHWFYGPDGALHSDFADSAMVMGVGLPDHIRLQSMRLVGRFSGAAPTRFTFTLGRASLTDASREPDTIVELATDEPGLTDPFDVTKDVTDIRLGPVDHSAFRYFFQVTAVNPDRSMSLHTVHLSYVNV